MKMLWLRRLDKKHPMVKIGVVMGAAMIAVGIFAVVGWTVDEIAEWQASTEAEIMRQLALENETRGVGEVTEMPDVANVGRQRQIAGKKLVALTFDDGPVAGSTERLLDVLREKDVRATFFVLGLMVERWPEVLRREVAEGHEVGNHTMNHKNFNRLGRGAQDFEIASARELIEGLTGQVVKYLRPPYGLVNGAVRESGAATVLWSVDPQDWKERDSGVIRGRVVSAVHDGAIIIMHDIYGSTVEAVPGIIDDLRAAGYEMVTVSELFDAKGWEVVPGGEYRRIGD